MNYPELIKNFNILVELLKSKGLNISTAESCTGGLISKLITDISGSSAVFNGGVVAYSNDVKVGCLGVKKETLLANGAVSVEVAGEMASGAGSVFNTSIAVSTTGIAGPDGGTSDKPVGTVCFGIFHNDSVAVYRELFSGTRDDVREQSAFFVAKRVIDIISNM